MVTTSVTRNVFVDASPKEAWGIFIDGINDWWPPEHCHSNENCLGLDKLFIALEDNMWGERTSAGEVMHWGKASVIVPNKHLELSWQMNAAYSPWRLEEDPERASIIDVRFTNQNNGTRVELTHSEFERHGPEAQKMIDVMIGLDRWSEWLDMFRTYAEK